MCGIYHIRADHQVLEQEIGRQRRISVDAADAGGAKDDSVKPLPVYPALYIGLPREIDLFSASHNKFTGFGLKPAHNGRTDHAAMAGHPDALGGNVEWSRSQNGLEIQQNCPF
jgi:hypothetical protein